jgi:6-pyruvoyltetrahydropterin/6-carboxytetrahydropterin synthase
MYEINVQRDFIARHFLIGGDWGKENFPHAHPYRLEIHLFGKTLDQHGYLVDITVVEDILKKLMEKYENQLLNDLPEFEAINPSLERFVGEIYQQVALQLNFDNISRLRIVLWETNEAYAAMEREL